MDVIERTRRKGCSKASRLVLPMVVGFALALGCDAPLPPADPAGGERPNVLLVVLDTVRADRLSSYGYERPTTPEIDSLARDFVRFDEFYAPSPWTVPSHASLFTGLYPIEHGATQEHAELDGRFSTLAEILRDEGYETWAASGNPFMGPAANLDQGFGTFVEAWRGTPITRPEGAPHPVNQGFERFLETRDEERPFFAFVNYMDAHEPFVPPPSHTDRFLRGELPREQALALGNRGWRRHWSESPFTQQQLAVLSDLYDAGLSQLSGYVGQLIGLVKRRDLYDDTLIIITSDHGEHFGENGAVGHFFSLYNTALRVPLLIRAPGATTGRVERRKGQSVDLFPTILAASGVDPSRFDHRGQDLLNPETRRTSVFSEYYYPAQVLGLFSPEVRARESARLAPHLRRQRAVQAFGYRLLWSSDGRHELYHVARDPGETRNLLAAESLDPGAQEFLRLLEEELSAYAPPADRGPGPTPPAAGSPLSHELDAESIEALRAVGYIE